MCPKSLVLPHIEIAVACHEIAKVLCFELFEEHLKEWQLVQGKWFLVSMLKSISDEKTSQKKRNCAKWYLKNQGIKFPFTAATGPGFIPGITNLRAYYQMLRKENH